MMNPFKSMLRVRPLDGDVSGANAKEAQLKADGFYKVDDQAKAVLQQVCAAFVWDWHAAGAD